MIARVLVVDHGLSGSRVKELVESEGSAFSCDLVSTEAASATADAVLYDAYVVAHHGSAGPATELVEDLSLSGPVILLTDVEDHVADRLALEAGAVDYLTKDVLSAQIVQRSLRYAIETWRERRRAESEYQKYLSLFDGVPAGLFRVDSGGMLLEVNASVVSYLGYDEKMQLVGKSIHELLADPDSRVPRFLTSLTGGKEVEFVRRDGQRVWATVTVEEVRAASGALMHYEGVAIDITDRKRAESGLSIRDELLDQVSCAVIVTDMEGECRLWNRHAEAMYGWSAEEAVGRPIYELTVPTDAVDSSVEIVESIVSEGRWEGEFTAQRRDGSLFSAQVSNSLLYDEQGQPIGIVGVSLDLTETKAAQAELRHYQELATAAYDHSSIGKAVVSLVDGRVVSANKALHDLLGYEEGGLAGLHFADFTHPEDIELDVSQFERLVSGEIDMYTVDKRYIRRDGSTVWGRMQGSVIGDEHGSEYALGQVVDITERKEAEDRIAFQASLLQQMRTPVIATDLKGVVTHWNRQAEEAYGWTAEEAVGREFISTVLLDVDPEQILQMRATLREHGVWEGELEITRQDGTAFPAWASGAVVRDGRGRPAGFVGAIVDLTDLRKARADASTQEMLNRSLLEAVSLPIAVLSAEGEIIASNPSWAETMDGSLRPYLPNCVADDDVSQQVTEGVGSVLAGELEQFSIEYQCDTDDGERWTRLVSMPIAAQVGGIVCHWDITDERFARVALEETIRAKDEFITSISHELRTPLSVVVGLAETLRIGRYNQDEKDEFHDLIADQSKEMALIVEDLLVAGRIDSDTLTVRCEMVDVEEEMRAVIHPWIKGDEMELDVRLRPGAEKVYADSLRVRQILRNLLSNAARYGEPPIEIRAVRARDRVLLSVADHGEGVPEQALDRMFQPYARFGAIDGQPSSVGLGLHVARRLARLMGGDLVYKRDSELTKFVLSLPAEPPDDSGRSNGLHLVRN